MEGIVVEEAIDAIETFARKYLQDDASVKTLAELNGVRFLLDGKLRRAEDHAVKLSEWPSATTAIMTLYKGDYEKAGELFETALKIRNKDAKVKNVFDSSVLTYFLILSYILSGTDKSRKKLSHSDLTVRVLVDGIALSRDLNAPTDEIS